jgi:hypothetical protein
MNNLLKNRSHATGNVLQLSSLQTCNMVWCTTIQFRVCGIFTQVGLPISVLAMLGVGIVFQRNRPSGWIFHTWQLPVTLWYHWKEMNMNSNQMSLILRVADHNFVLKIFSSYPVHGLTNEGNKNTSVSIATLRANFLNLRHHDYEAKLQTTRSLSLVK